MIKAVFFDLDGTLLNSQKIISDKTKYALMECKNKGINLFVATARPPILNKMLSRSKDYFNLFDGGVFCNGGCIKINNQVTYKFLPKEIVSYCINETNKYKNLNIALQMKDERHAFNNPLDDFAYKPWGIAKEDAVYITNDCLSQTIKILIYYENIIDTVTKLPDKIVKELRQYCGEYSKFYLTDKGKVIQITSKSASKYKGIEAIRKKLGIQKSELAVFGDDMNDVEMLTAYENTVAMGNADEQIKKIAQFVTKSNDDDGIFYALTELLKIV